jgi:hypothetical protein
VELKLAEILAETFRACLKISFSGGLARYLIANWRASPPLNVPFYILEIASTYFFPN